MNQKLISEKEQSGWDSPEDPSDPFAYLGDQSESYKNQINDLNNENQGLIAQIEALKMDEAQFIAQSEELEILRSHKSEPKYHL